MRSVAGELQSLSQAFRKSQGQYLKRAFIKESRSQCSGSDLDSSPIQDAGHSPHVTLFCTPLIFYLSLLNDYFQG